MFAWPRFFLLYYQNGMFFYRHNERDSFYDGLFFCYGYMVCKKQQMLYDVSLLSGADMFLNEFFTETAGGYSDLYVVI